MRRYSGLALLLACVALVLIAASTILAGTTELVSVGTDGLPGNCDSYYPNLSPDGRFVVFQSCASNLVAEVQNDFKYYQIYFRDKQTGATELVSGGYDGAIANDNCNFGVTSADGRFVAFDSRASNLIHGVTDSQIYLRDRQTGNLELISAAPDGSPGDDVSSNASISADGRFVAFYSNAANLVSTSMLRGQVFVRDRQTGTTEVVSVSGDGSPADLTCGFPVITPDGRYVAFTSYADNLVLGVMGGYLQVFVRDRQTGTTEIVSTTNAGISGDYDSGTYGISMSADGRYVAFESEASNFAPNLSFLSEEIYVHDRQTGHTDIILPPTSSSSSSSNMYPAISADGKVIALTSMVIDMSSYNITTQVLLYDRHTGKSETISVSPQGVAGDYYSDSPSISADGRIVAYESDSTNLVPGVTAGIEQVYTYIRPHSANMLTGLASDGSIWYTSDLANWNSIQVQIPLSSLVVGDFNGDGVIDVAGLSSDGTVWYSTDMRGMMGIPGHMKSLVVGDFNGDGKDDLAGLTEDGRIWYSTDLKEFVNVPGRLSSMIAADFNGNGSYGIAGIASDNTIWVAPDVASWQNIPGYLNVLAAGDFAGNGKSGLVGAASDDSMWLTTDLSAWTNIPGMLTTVVTGDFAGTGKSGIAGLAFDGTIWYTIDGANWTNIPGNLTSLVVGDFNADGKADLVGLASDGSIWCTTDLATWTKVPGSLTSICSK